MVSVDGRGPDGREDDQGDRDQRIAPIAVASVCAQGCALVTAEEPYRGTTVIVPFIPIGSCNAQMYS